MRAATLIGLFAGLASAGCGSSVDYTAPTPFARFDEVVATSTVSYSFSEPEVDCGRFIEYPAFVQLTFGDPGSDGGPQLLIRVGEVGPEPTTYAASNVSAIDDNDIGPPLRCSEGPCASFAWRDDPVDAVSHHQLDQCALDAMIVNEVLHGTFQCQSMRWTSGAVVDIVDGTFLCALR